MTEGKARIAVTGLATMGSNLARNLARHGFKVAVHNRTPAKMKALIEEHGHEGDFVGAETLLLLELDGLEMDVTARVGREAKVRLGERLEVAFDLAAAHLFDRSTGRVLTGEQRAG